jgi:hypothetical protein
MRMGEQELKMAKTLEKATEPKGYISLTFEFHKEKRQWVGTCRELGTSTFNRSLPEANKQLNELVILHLDTLEKNGERERFFKENNIVIYPVKPRLESIKLPPVKRENTYIRPSIHQLPFGEPSMC